MSIVRRSDERAKSSRKIFDGVGEVTMWPILSGPDEMLGKGRLFNHGFIEPGNSLGWHIHRGDCETYYILRGHGEYSDNGTIVEVFPGDVTFVNDGEGHSIKNIGDETLEFIAMILYT